MSEVQDSIEKIRSHLKGIDSCFIDRSDHIRMMGICAMSRIPMLLVGSPGTAKTDVVSMFASHLNVDDYFEYTLNKFTEPAEVFGPIDISSLKEGRQLRIIKGFLPTAKIAFLDEIFKANSAILNSFLTILNERKFSQDGKSIQVPLRFAFAASNEIPENPDLAAITDRFVVKAEFKPVKDQYLGDLIAKSIDNKKNKLVNYKPNHGCSIEDYDNVYNYLQNMSKNVKGNEFIKQTFEQNAWVEFSNLLFSVEKDHKIKISDRKKIQLFNLCITHALIEHGGLVKKSDLNVIRYAGNSISEMDHLKSSIERCIGLG